MVAHPRVPTAHTPGQRSSAAAAVSTASPLPPGATFGAVRVTQGSA
jgi:hypothetical protein